MQKYWLKREGNERLILFMLGWACSHRAVSHFIPAGYDVLAVYDYRTIEPFDPADFASYRSTTLFAWSFGVWAAEQACAAIGWSRAVAFNGTPLPVDDRFGIPRKYLTVTLKGIRQAGMEPFDRKAYGVYYPQMSLQSEERAFGERCEELERLVEQASVPYEPRLRWTDAVIGTEDRIFPVANMSAYWTEKWNGEVLRLSLPHYPFGDTSLMYNYLQTI